jgi:two-component system response regulator AtoC
MRVLIVDDERNIRESMQRLLDLEGIESVTAENGKAATERLLDASFDAVVADLKMPVMGGQELLEWIRDEGIRTPVIMISAFGEIEDAVRALKSGASDYLIKPFDPAELIHRVRSIVASRKREVIMEADSRSSGESRFVGESSVMKDLKGLLEKVSGSGTTVLITGESGTGKELFGHEKGACTGADSRKLGLFELAGNGTLFLDEIGEMPLPLQVKLLRVLQERKLRRLGGTRDIPMGARIISATNRDIEALVREGKFREDLYYRLNVVRIAMPPLRARIEDLPLLSGYILGRIHAKTGKGPFTLEPAALEFLMSYPFPGNIRELENILERAAIYCEGGKITIADIDLPKTRLVGKSANVANRQSATGETPVSLSDAAKVAIVRALVNNKGNRTRAAEELGISRRTLLYKLKRYGIE